MVNKLEFHTELTSVKAWLQVRISVPGRASGLLHCRCHAIIAILYSWAAAARRCLGKISCTVWSNDFAASSCWVFSILPSTTTISNNPTWNLLPVTIYYLLFNSHMHNDIANPLTNSHEQTIKHGQYSKPESTKRKTTHQSKSGNHLTTSYTLYLTISKKIKFCRHGRKMHTRAKFETHERHLRKALPEKLSLHPHRQLSKRLVAPCRLLHNHSCTACLQSWVRYNFHDLKGKSQDKRLHHPSLIRALPN